MLIEILRTYFPNGTNGELLVNGKLKCYTIELPWKENESRVSCIPEGTYQLVKRNSLKYGQHLLVTNVPGRDLILIHPANNALKELKGCIAPVTKLTGPGLGQTSKPRLIDIVSEAYKAMAAGDDVFLTITKNSHE